MSLLHKRITQYIPIIIEHNDGKRGELKTQALRIETLVIVVCDLRLNLVYVGGPFGAGSRRSITVNRQ